VDADCESGGDTATVILEKTICLSERSGKNGIKTQCLPSTDFQQVAGVELQSGNVKAAVD
jgi:hypothetical protein